MQTVSAFTAVAMKQMLYAGQAERPLSRRSIRHIAIPKRVDAALVAALVAKAHGDIASNLT